MSNEARVRVDCFSKIIASTCPASGASASALPFGQPARAALRSIASASIAATASPPASDRFRKCRISPSVLQERKTSGLGRRIARRARRQFLDAFIDMALFDIERRQDAHDIVARGLRQQPVIVAQMRDERTAFALDLDAEKDQQRCVSGTAVSLRINLGV